MNERKLRKNLLDISESAKRARWRQDEAWHSMKRGFSVFRHTAGRRPGGGDVFRRLLFGRKTPVRDPIPPPTPPPPGTTSKPYFDLSRYKNVWSKAAASLRYGLNRFQPWTADHRLAIASWMAVGTVWWAVAGTSTLLSVVIFVIPSERFQQAVARKVSEHATRFTGATVTFKSAIQPTWKTLRFHDVRDSGCVVVFLALICCCRLRFGGRRKAAG